MSLPINVKFEVPKLSAPPPSKTSLWPSLTPPANQKAPPAGARRSEAEGKTSAQAQSAVRPITATAMMNLKAGRREVSRSARKGRSLLVKAAVSAIPVFALVAFLGLGCATEKPKPRASVLDVKAAPETAYAPVQQPPAYQAPVPTPAVAVAQPKYRPAASIDAVQPVLAEPAPAPQQEKPVKSVARKTETKKAESGKSYVVQPGDTLFGIAKDQYGDGNKWKRIAAANPGLSPSSIKVGQKLVIPL